MEFRLGTLALVLPGSNVHVVGVVPLCLAFLGLALDTEMTAARLVAVECVISHQHADFEEVFQTESLLEFLVELELGTGNIHDLRTPT